ncbi:Protein of uncharacterised function (DUF1602) [Achromobacter sp. 2789STDY5608628]|nr:Protein of uncharacterised function (DUF1602) [Achromobacter sp. 2789STDY5608628]
MMTLRPRTCDGTCSGEISSARPSAVCTVPSPATLTSIRFIGGEPMKPATKVEAGFSNTSIGVPICSGTPWYMTIMRCASVMASTWSCVTYRLVVPRRRCSFMISRRIATRSLASRFDSGSSNRNTLGSRTMARPMATRWRWPPDKARGRRSSRWLSSRICAAASTRFLISSLENLRIFRPYAMFSNTVMCG